MILCCRSPTANLIGSQHGAHESNANGVCTLLCNMAQCARSLWRESSESRDVVFSARSRKAQARSQIDTGFDPIKRVHQETISSARPARAKLGWRAASEPRMCVCVCICDDALRCITSEYCQHKLDRPVPSSLRFVVVRYCIPGASRSCTTIYSV